MYSAGLPAYAPTGQHRLPDYQQALQPTAQTNWIWPSPSPTMTRSPYPWATVDQASANNNVPAGYCYSPYPACTSADHTYKTHMITDILKAQNSDPVKVPNSYQSKSPTGTGAHMYADIRATAGELPLTRQLNVNGYNGHCPQPGARFPEMSAVPSSHSFSFPATTGYEAGTCSAREGMTNGSVSHNGIVNSNSTSHYVDQLANVTSGTVPMFSPPLGTSIPSLSPSTITNPRSLPQLKDIHQSVEDEKKKTQKKGRATFSGTQIDELEKAFHVSQYLSTHDRHILAERLGLTENQIKIWFQNRRTKCRRTAWKSRSPSCSKVPTTPTSPSPHTPTTPTTPSTPSSTNSSPTPLTIKLPPIM